MPIVTFLRKKAGFRRGKDAKTGNIPGMVALIQAYPYPGYSLFSLFVGSMYNFTHASLERAALRIDCATADCGTFS